VVPALGTPTMKKFGHLSIVFLDVLSILKIKIKKYNNYYPVL